ncbi:MAG: kinase/pyrophosphorylase [Deltaproteobacteria bacterium]|jgi:regulator of PEP synthase PpsR (kinase-PPPase family)|nr:kinase/pyrophosphorylase [Deltaproteobacteria bacterium]
MAETDSTRTIFILADGTGETAEKVSQAALTQFRGIEVQTETFTRVRSKFEIREIMERAAKEHAFVVYTVIDPEHREFIQSTALELQVEVSDLIGGLVLKLGHVFGVPPLFATGIKHQLDEEYFRRIEAVEFAVKSDDGQSLQNLKRADMVLVGLSRTSKTPLSMYLAHKGFKVANVPLVPEIPAPKEMFELDQERVYALIIDLNSLVRVRHQRLRQLGLPPDAEYAARENIARELRWCREFYARHPTWPVVDTSGRAVEETAAELIRIMKEREARRS